MIYKCPIKRTLQWMLIPVPCLVPGKRVYPEIPRCPRLKEHVHQEPQIPLQIMFQALRPWTFLFKQPKLTYRAHADFSQILKVWCGSSTNMWTRMSMACALGPCFCWSGMKLWRIWKLKIQTWHSRLLQRCICQCRRISEHILTVFLLVWLITFNI